MPNDKKNQTAYVSEISTPVSFLLRNRQVVMSLGLSLLVFGWPFIHNVDVVDRFFELIIFIVFLAAVPALYVSRAWTGMLVVFAVLAIGASWLSEGRLSGLGLISSLASIAFYGRVMVHEVHVVFLESRRATWDTILGAIIWGVRPPNNVIPLSSTQRRCLWVLGEPGTEPRARIHCCEAAPHMGTSCMRLCW